MSKTLQTRTMQKIDTAANWAKATSFVPLKGEICVYSDTNQIKIGDGKKYLSELPFLDGKLKTINNIEPDENGNIQLTAEIPSFSVSGTTLIIGSTSLPKPLIAYAVYSADDNSLSFYKTADTITEGSNYRGKTATVVFPDIENKAFELNGNPIPYPIWTLYSGQFNLFMNSIIFVDKGISPTSTASWFTNLRNCTNIIGLNKLDTSNVTDMSNMFAGLEITSIDVSEWDTSTVTNMNGMFNYCTRLTSIGDISDWDTSNVTDMSNMFAYCSQLTAVDCSKWDVNKVTTHTDFKTSGVTGVIAPTWKN